MSDSLFDQYKAALRRGHLAALAGDLDGALEAYADAGDMVPERALPIASQGTVLHRLGRWSEAAAAFDLALRMAPDDEASLRARAEARDERGLRSGAAADFERLAFVLDVGGRSADAAAAARRAADLAPSAAREMLADRLTVAAAHVADLVPAAPPRSAGPAQEAAAAPDDDPPTEHAVEASAIDTSDLDDEGFDRHRWTEAMVSDADAELEPVLELEQDSGARDSGAQDSGAPSQSEQPAPRMDAASMALAAKIAELGTQPTWVEMAEREIGAVGEDGASWPALDLPSPPPPPLEGSPPDPETLLAEAATLIAAGDIATARDKMLIAVMVHREAGLIDAALEVCLQLLTTAPGDPQVHLAIANLQLDRGWTALATEKIELLKRLTALTGDTQAEADVHGLASERLRDNAMGTSPGR